MAWSDLKLDHRRVITALLQPSFHGRIPWKRPKPHTIWLHENLCWPTIGQQWDPLSPVEGERPHILVMYHRHSNTPVRAWHRRIRISDGLMKSQAKRFFNSYYDTTAKTDIKCSINQSVFAKAVKKLRGRWQGCKILQLSQDLQNSQI